MAALDRPGGFPKQVRAENPGQIPRLCRPGPVQCEVRFPGGTGKLLLNFSATRTHFNGLMRYVILQQGWKPSNDGASQQDRSSKSTIPDQVSHISRYLCVQPRPLRFPEAAGKRSGRGTDSGRAAGVLSPDVATKSPANYNYNCNCNCGPCALFELAST